MTVEEILAALQAILDAAGADPLSDEQQAEVAELERKLQVVRTDGETRARVAAYSTVVTPRPNVASPAEDTPEVRAFQAYMRTGEKRAQSEGVPSEGGYLVPSTFRDKLVECIRSFGGAAAEVETITTSTGGNLEWPTVSDAPGGVPNEGTITAEGAEFQNGADLVFGTNNLGAYKYTSTGANNDPLRVSVELLQDAAFDVEGLVRRFMAERIARKQAKHWAYGNGVGQPLGILTGTPKAELTGSNNFSTGSNGYAKLLEIENTIDEAYLGNAKWFFNRTTWAQIASIVDDIGRPLVQRNSEAGIGQGMQRTLLGYPVVIDNSFPDPATDVNFMAFGDLRQGYVIRRVRDLTLMVNPYNRAEYGQVEYTAWERADGTIQNSCAYAIVKGADA